MEEPASNVKSIHVVIGFSRKYVIKFALAGLKQENMNNNMNKLTVHYLKTNKLNYCSNHYN